MPDVRRSSGRTNEERPLRHILELLQPYGSEVTLIGGWVPYLYQQYDDFPKWRTRIAGTTELDVLLPTTLVKKNRRPLAELLISAGFSTTPESGGAIWSNPNAGEEIEFFTSHTGTARQVGTTRPITGQADVGAIQLRELSLLIRNTKVLTLISSRRSSQQLTVRVPTLGAYVLNKALTFIDRPSSADGGSHRGAKDIVYICDVLSGGERVTERVRIDILGLNEQKAELVRLRRTAAQRLSMIIERPTTLMDTAVQQRAEREAASEDAARSEMLGYLETLHSILKEPTR